MSHYLRSYLVGALALSAGLLTVQNTMAAPLTSPSINAVTFSVPPAVGTLVTFSASYSDLPSGVGEKCFLVLKDIPPIEMSPSGAALASNGTLSVKYTITNAGRYSVQVRCEDTVTQEAAAVVEGETSFIDVGSSAAPSASPAITAPTPAAATVGTPITISSSYTNFPSGSAYGCYLVVNDAIAPSAYRLTDSASPSGIISYTYTFSSAGGYTIRTECWDNLSGTSHIVGSNTSLTVSPASAVTPDTSAPAVGEPSPLTATIGSNYDFSVTYSDVGSGVSGCTVTVPSLGASSLMTLVGTPTNGTASQRIGSTSFTGNFTISISCVDVSGNQSPSVTRTVVVSQASSATPALDTTAPTIGEPTPLTATVGTDYSFSATYSDAGSGLSYCTLDTAGVSGGPYAAVITGSQSNGTVNFVIPGTAFTGSFTIKISCVDKSGNSNAAAQRTVVVSSVATPTPTPTADIVAPAVSITTPGAATLNVPTTIRATYTDAVGVVQCTLYIDGDSAGSMTRSSGVSTAGLASTNHIFTTSGPHASRVECTDLAGNRGVGASSNISVSALPVSGVDTSAPTVSGVSLASAVVNVASSVYAAFADTVGVAACYLYVDGSNVGVMTTSGGGATNGITARNYAFTTSGAHAVRTECVDAAGNRGVGSSSVVNVAPAAVSTPGAPIINTNPAAPGVSGIYPSSVGVNAETSYAISFTSNIGVIGCSFYVNGLYTGAMGLSGTATRGAANYRHTFATAGSYDVHAECVDDARNRSIGQTTRVTASNNPIATTPAPSVPASVATSIPAQGTLIKLVCPDGADANHPCKAVYYYGHDGRRHAFPHERIFFTWYSGFSGIIEVTDRVIASIPLGTNVTYRPGVRLLKFTSVPQVYVVTRGGVLRWIATAELAATLYGPNWAQNVHDLTDAYYSNYTFGANITSASQYNPVGETNAVTTIDDNL